MKKHNLTFTFKEPGQDVGNLVGQITAILWPRNPNTAGENRKTSLRNQELTGQKDLLGQN